MRLFAGLIAGLWLLLTPVAATADDGAPPKYPPSFDCSAVPAGTQRQACNRSHLDPPMGAIEAPKRVQPDGVVPSVNPQPLPTAKPPTIPRLPGTIQNRN
jgi:hypothetical protein